MAFGQGLRKGPSDQAHSFSLQLVSHMHGGIEKLVRSFFSRSHWKNLITLRKTAFSKAMHGLRKGRGQNNLPSDQAHSFSLPRFTRWD
jgi:hypothetical protein